MSPVTRVSEADQSPHPRGAIRWSNSFHRPRACYVTDAWGESPSPAPLVLTAGAVMPVSWGPKGAPHARPAPSPTAGPPLALSSATVRGPAGENAPADLLVFCVLHRLKVYSFSHLSCEGTSA